MNFGKTSLRGRPRNRWQDDMREDGRIVGGRKKYITDNGKELSQSARANGMNEHGTYTMMYFLNLYIKSDVQHM